VLHDAELRRDGDFVVIENYLRYVRDEDWQWDLQQMAECGGIYDMLSHSKQVFRPCMLFDEFKHCPPEVKAAQKKVVEFIVKYALAHSRSPATRPHTLSQSHNRSSRAIGPIMDSLKKLSKSNQVFDPVGQLRPADQSIRFHHDTMGGESVFSCPLVRVSAAEAHQQSCKPRMRHRSRIFLNE